MCMHVFVARPKRPETYGAATALGSHQGMDVFANDHLHELGGACSQAEAYLAGSWPSILNPSGGQ